MDELAWFCLFPGESILSLRQSNCFLLKTIFFWPGFLLEGKSSSSSSDSFSSSRRLYSIASRQSLLLGMLLEFLDGGYYFCMLDEAFTTIEACLV